MMKYILVALFLLLAPIAQAYNPTKIEVEEPFTVVVIPMDETGQRQSYLGTLESFPHLYEFTLAEATTLQIQTRQRAQADAEPVNLILLAVNPDTERISEIVRLNTPITERTRDFVGGLGITVIESDVVEVDLEAGVYRLEVSTPLNQRPYELDFGIASNDNTYFGTFATIWEVQRHFEYWWTRYLLSTFVLYQLGIVVMLLGLIYVIRLRKTTADTVDA
jgi:hypothetical protein